MTTELKERLRLKWLPFEPDDDTLAKAEQFLQMSDAEQTSLIQASRGDEAEWYIELLTARAMYKDPVDRNPGSITQEKVDRYPERYDWKLE